jgi:hypothetical protein
VKFFTVIQLLSELLGDRPGLNICAKRSGRWIDEHNSPDTFKICTMTLWQLKWKETKLCSHKTSISCCNTEYKYKLDMCNN